MTEMAGVEVIPIDLTEIIGDIEIPCFYDCWAKCGPRAAKWVMVVRCGCGAGAERLACESCHDLLVATEACITCPICEEVFHPARRAFARMERI